MKLSTAIQHAIETRDKHSIITGVIKDDSGECFNIATRFCVKYRLKKDIDNIIILYPANNADLTFIKDNGGNSSLILIESIITWNTY